MSRASIAFLAGLGGGYLSAQEKQAARDRQDRIDARQEEEFNWRRDEQARQKKDREALAKAGETAAVNEGAVTLNTGDGAKVYDMPNAADVAGSDARQFRRNQEASLAQGIGADLMSQPAGAAPAPAVQPTIKSTFAVRGTGYDSKEVAQKAADDFNAPDAVNKRTAAAYRATGRPTEALQLESSAKQGKLTDIQLAQAQAAQAHDLAFREITEAFSRNGWSAVPKIYENYKDGKTAQVVEDGKGGATVTMFDADGKQVGSKTFASEMDFITGAVAKLDPKLWVSMRAQEKKDTQAQSNADRTFQLAVNADKRADRADARAGAAAALSARNPGLKKIEEVETILGRKLTQEERVRLSGVGKEDDKADITFATDIVKEAVKGGSVTPEDAPAARQGLVNQIKGGRELEKIRAGLAKAKADGKMAEAVAQLRANGMSDEAIQGMGGEVPAGAAPAASPKPAKAPATGPVTAAAPATSVATSAGALPNPVEAAGVQLDRARAQLNALLQGPRPGLAAGRAAMDAHAAKVQAARQAVAKSEAEYQRLLPQQGAAFVRQSI